MLRSSGRRTGGIAEDVHSTTVDQGAVIGEGLLLSSDYIDSGCCTEICEFCGALFWFCERVKSVALSVRARYNGCCKGGRVRLAFPVDPRQLLKDLMLRVNFRVNIRVYNSMFSMTSFGAKVDDSINQGSSPYIFKVAGQISH